MTTKPYRRKTSVQALLEKVADPAHPLSAMIEIADRCNEVCVHCYQVQGQKGEMTTDEVKHVLDELAEMGVLFLTISGGEATLRHDFLELVAHARARRFAVKIYTNGLTMTEPLARSLAALAVSEVQISLYSPRPEVHDGVTGVPGSFDKTTRGVRNLVAARVPVVVKTPLMRVNEDDVAGYRALAEALGADWQLDVAMLDAREDGDVSPHALDPSLRALQAMTRDPELRAPEPVATRSLDDAVCAVASSAMIVEPNGELRPCTQLAVPIGRAREGSLRDAWEGGASARALRALRWRDLVGCRICDLRDHCSRCYARALAETGDAFGPYARACAAAAARWEAIGGEAFEVLPPARADRDPRLGPYRRAEGGRFLPVDDVESAADRALREAHGWSVAATRGDRGPTALVRLRTRAQRTVPVEPPARGVAGEVGE